MRPDPALFLTTPVIPVLTITRVEDAVPLARALVAGGLPVLEVTLRTPAALDAIRAIRAAVPDALVGAGTVVEAGQIAPAVVAGARFLVSPGTPPDLGAAFVAAPVPVFPGCQTLSEAMALAARGFEVVKFFPAEPAGGTAWLKAVAAPLPNLRFMPTGGIGPDNAPRYLALSNVVAVGGSWIVPADALATGEWTRIEKLARAAASLPRA